MDPSNNIPAVYYDNSTYEEVKKMDQAYKGAVYASYGVLFFGLLTDKVIGVELFGLLQLSYLSVSNLNYVQPLLSPLMNLSIVNGINLNLFQRNTADLPDRIREIGYNVDFLSNINAMLGLMVAWTVVSASVYVVGFFVVSAKEKLQNIAKRMLKEYLLMLLAFNSYNIAFSFGLQVIYNQSSSMVFNVAAGALAVASFAAMIATIQFSESSSFGEFISHYKDNPICTNYFVVVLLYRAVLGFCTAALNEIEEMTIVNVFTGILFMMYLGSNLPYKMAYHNYRAIMVQFSSLAVLAVTMYYRSMKSFASPDAVFHNLAPAFLEIILMFGCVGVSVGCLAYELYLKISNWIKQRKPAQIADSNTSPDVKKPQRVNTE